MDDLEERSYGTLGRAFWRTLAERIEKEPRLAELLENEEVVRELGAEAAKMCEPVAHSILETLLERMPGMLDEHRQERTRFEVSLQRVWGEALGLLETFIVIASEAGDDLNRRHWDAAASEDDHTFHALIRVHARSCLVANEILTLLKAGYPSGAHARWRTLHELACVAYFLREHDQDVAERYLRHDVIQAYKAAIIQRRYSEYLAEEAISDEEFDWLKAERDKLVAEYGTDFKHEYGWSAKAFGTQGKNFADVEAAVNLDYVRPYYRMASNAVHPNVRGSFFDLGVADHEHMLLVGPSTRGLADPGISACRSLLQTTICLHGHRVFIDELVVMLIVQELAPKVEEAFIRAHHAHEVESGPAPSAN